MLAISSISPAKNEQVSDLSSDISFQILEDTHGIDLSSIKVTINDQFVYSDLSFADGWNGVNSDITYSGDVLIVIDKESNFQKSTNYIVKIQAKNNNGDFLNYKTYFSTVPEKPVLLFSSPKTSDVLYKHQFLYFEFEDLIDGIDNNSINIELAGQQLVTDGVIDNTYLGALSEITTRTDNLGVIIKLDPFLQYPDGLYHINYSISDTLGNTLFGNIDFEVKSNDVVLPPIFPQTGFVGFFQGITTAQPSFEGPEVSIEWGQIALRNYQSEGFALIYSNESRLSLFDSNPQFIASKTVNSGIIPGLTMGKNYSFGVRAMEAYKNSWNLTGMNEVSQDIFEIPTELTLTQTLTPTDLIIYVSSTLGYPTAGFLKIENEIIKYNGFTAGNDGFLVTTNGRGVSNTTAGAYLSGTTVSLFLSCTDSNTVIIMAVPYYGDGYQTDRTLENVGLVVNDFSDNDQTFTQPFDFCGYHRAEPYNVLNGKEDCGSYLGGVFNGYRGMRLFDRMIANEEVLLNTTGEPVILLKRLWSGQVCSCVDSRRGHPRNKSCEYCYGTGYVGGFTQYVNMKRNDRLVMLSFADTVEDLKLGQGEGLTQDMEPQAWTVPNPAIKDRDYVVRFDFNGDVEYIYEVLNVSREKAIFRHYTRQRLSLKRIDKTSIIYSYPFTIPNNIGVP